MNACTLFTIGVSVVFLTFVFENNVWTGSQLFVKYMYGKRSRASYTVWRVCSSLADYWHFGKVLFLGKFIASYDCSNKKVCTSLNIQIFLTVQNKTSKPKAALNLVTSLNWLLNSKEFVLKLKSLNQVIKIFFQKERNLCIILRS